MEGLCAVCPLPGTLKCSRCKSVSFCSVEHQALLWPTHKHLCKTLTPGLRFTQPSLALGILSHYSLGPGNGAIGGKSYEETIAGCNGRFNQLYHPSTTKTVFVCFQPFIWVNRTTPVTTPSDLLWTNYKTIMHYTAPEGRSDAIGTVYAWFIANKERDALPKSLIPYAMLAAVFLGPPSVSFCGILKLENVHPRIRNAFELQALTVFGLVEERAETVLVELALVRLRALAGVCKVMLRLCVDVAKAVGESLGAQKADSKAAPVPA